MIVFFNLIGLGMLAISAGVWFALATYVPNIGGQLILSISLAIFFLLDVIYRVTLGKKHAAQIKLKSQDHKGSVLRKDIAALLPAPISIAISDNLGGNLMFLPCWLVSVLLAIIYLV